MGSIVNQSSCLCSAYSAAEVALDQSLGVQLGPEMAAELHQVIDGRPRHQSLILLHHGPARVLQDQQANVSERRGEEEGRVKGGRRCSGLSHVSTTRRRRRLRDEGAVKMERRGDSLAELFRFNEDVEVGFLELLHKHAEDVRRGREISQVVDDQVVQQLRGDNQDRGGQNHHHYRALKTNIALCVCV